MNPLNTDNQEDLSFEVTITLPPGNGDSKYSADPKTLINPHGLRFVIIAAGAMTEHAHTLNLTPKEVGHTTVFLNIILRGATDDPTFAGRFPATTGEFRAKILNDVFFRIFGRDHDEIVKRYGRKHEHPGVPSRTISLTDTEREMFHAELKNELDSRPQLKPPYRKILESIANKLI